jgi:hypothetical protein
MAMPDFLRTKSRAKKMNKIVIELANTICWDRKEEDKVYLKHVQVVIGQFACATRQVFMRFAGGPELDLSFFDMDRLAIAYLKLRGITLPTELSDLTNAEPPPRCDFVVPNWLMSGFLRKTDAEVPKEPVKEKPCARCGQSYAYSGEWYGDLCPECADNTEGDWVCRFCNRRGDFEEMGGSGARNPNCCGSPCNHVKTE